MGFMQTVTEEASASVKLKPSTLASIESMKVHPRETKDDVVKRALAALLEAHAGE